MGGILGSLLNGNPMAMAEAASISIAGLVTALVILLGILMLASVFVIPRGYRVFWLLLVTLTLLFVGAFRIYQEWVDSAESENSDSYRQAAKLILTIMTVVYTIVFVAVMFAMLWKIGVLAKRKSDLIDNKPPRANEQKKPPGQRKKSGSKHKRREPAGVSGSDLYM